MIEIIAYHDALYEAFRKLNLFSNHQLKSALKLYEKYGFGYVEMKNSPFETADIKMELILKHA